MPPGAGNDEDELDDEALHSDEAADLPGTLFRAPTLLCQADGMVSWFVVIPLSNATNSSFWRMESWLLGVDSFEF